MTRTANGIVGTLAALFIASASLAFPNEPDGFRGLKWGTLMSEVTDQFDQSTPSQDKVVKIHRRLNDKMSIGDADLSDVVYGFHNGELQSVMVKALGNSNKRALMRAFQAQFGPGYQANRYIDRYTWFGSVARISLDCSARDECLGLILSTVGAAKEEAARRSAAEGAKKDF